ncbi:MAG: hypothetical protein AAGM38_09895 [Pseudomonadota bacterium]
MRDTPYSADLVGRRIRALITYMDVGKSEFGRIVGYTPQQVNAVTLGHHLPNPAVVYKIYLVTSVTSDWTIYGLAKGLSDLRTCDRIRLLQFEEEA